MAIEPQSTKDRFTVWEFVPHHLHWKHVRDLLMASISGRHECAWHNAGFMQDENKTKTRRESKGSADDGEVDRHH